MVFLLFVVNMIDYLIFSSNKNLSLDYCRCLGHLCFLPTALENIWGWIHSPISLPVFVSEELICLMCKAQVLPDLKV